MVEITLIHKCKCINKIEVHTVTQQGNLLELCDEHLDEWRQPTKKLQIPFSIYIFTH